MNRILLPALLLMLALPAQAIERYLTGNFKDVHPAVLHGPVLDLAGGGSDVETAFQRMIDTVRGCTNCDTTLDVVVLRSSGANGYNPWYYTLHGIDSIESFVINDRMDAYNPEVVKAISNAEVVFVAGGDQCYYVEFFANSPIEDAVKSVYDRGGGVGGTSAGLAIQGQIVYDACHDASAVSDKSMADPYYDEITFTNDFFAWPIMHGTFTDTHFVARNRLGRLLTFLARSFQENPDLDSVLGIGVNERTSVLVGPDGIGQVMGTGPAYFILADHFPEVTVPGKPLTYCDYKVWKIGAGGTFDLKHRPTIGFYNVSVNEGKLTSDPY